MKHFGKDVEKMIQDAMDRGEFDNLPGKGKPLVLEDDSHVPEDLRMAYRIMKRNKIAPEEVLMHKEIGALRAMLLKNSDLPEAEKERLKKELKKKELQHSLMLERFKKQYFGL